MDKTASQLAESVYERAYKDVLGTINALESAVMDLLRRVNPGMRPPGPAPAEANGPQEVRAAQSEVVDELCEINGRLCGLEDVVRSAITRLDI